MAKIIKTKAKAFKHLDCFERSKLEVWRNEGLTFREIGIKLNRDPGVLCREINKNKSAIAGKYTAEVAHSRALDKRRIRGQRNLLKNDLILGYVEEGLKEGWSPEQISLRLKLDTVFSISHEAVYQWIYDKNTDKKWRKYLTCSHRQRHRKGYRKVQKLERLNTLPSIENRPKEVDLRLTIGNWEDDSICSRKSNDRIKSVNERFCGIVFFTKVKNGSKEESNKATINSLSNFPSKYLKTLTRDRGTENYGYELIEKELQMSCYFAHPYCSHERGSNENLNGLFRRYFPKGTDFSKITNKEVKEAERLINNRPRKRFEGLTPVEVLYILTGVAITY